MTPEQDSEEQKHGIQGGTYYNTPLGPTACLECLCGEEFSGDTWGWCGEQLDDHLEKVDAIERQAKEQKT